MRIDPALRALRSDDAPQRHAQDLMAAAADRWRADPAVSELTAAAKAYGKGDPLAQCGPLFALFAKSGDAAGLANRFISHFLPVLAEAPLGQVPARYGMNGSVMTLQLARYGRVSLTLVAFDGQALNRRPAAQSVTFADSERHEAILAGSGEARIIRTVAGPPDHAALDIAPQMLQPDVRLSLDLQREALLVDAVRGRLITLRLNRFSENPAPAREYALADGKLVHQAAGDLGESCRELMLGLLGRMGRKDAAPVMAQMAAKGSNNLRWQALRECLALDSAAGFTALCAIARDPADPLAPPAGALRAQLLDAHLVLAQFEPAETEICPA